MRDVLQRVLPAIIGLFFVCPLQPAAAQDVSVIDLVEECDILAAHPADPERMAEGVADDIIVPRLAILACEDAVARVPEDPRFVFQMGRALLALGREEEAVGLFREAAERGYAAAWAYLGDAYQFGLGVEPDGQQAYDAYAKARSGGFLEATAQIEQLTFDADQYTTPFAGYFFQGDYARIRQFANDPGQKWLWRNYVFNFIQSLVRDCQPFLTPANVPALYGFRYPDDWTAQSDANVAIAIQTSIAEYDADAFLGRHGCDGLIARHMFRSIDTFLATKP